MKLDDDELLVSVALDLTEEQKQQQTPEIERPEPRSFALKCSGHRGEIRSALEGHLKDVHRYLEEADPLLKRHVTVTISVT